jgi:hypothetical protein
VARVDEWQSPGWKGNPCTSDAWPFSSDATVFEARRAVVQLVKTFGSGMDPPGMEASDTDPALRYIRATKDLEAIMSAIRQDLVAEARSRDVQWGAIGRAQGIGGTGAQKAGKNGLSDERLEELKIEAFVSWMGRKAARPHELPTEVVEVLGGATPLERLAFLALHALRTLREIDVLLTTAEPDPENASDALKSACRRIERVLKAVAVDHEMWDAMATAWPGSPLTVDQANYHAPPTYLLHSMRLFLFALLYAPDEHATGVGRFHSFLVHVRHVYATALLILERPDVGSAIPAPE